MWEKYGTARQATDNIIRLIRFACCITNATDIHSEYIILNTFPQQQWLHKLIPVLCLYVHFLSSYNAEKINTKEIARLRTPATEINVT